jgi:hypothetical protein
LEVLWVLGSLADTKPPFPFDESLKDYILKKARITKTRELQKWLGITIANFKDRTFMKDLLLDPKAQPRVVTAMIDHLYLHAEEHPSDYLSFWETELDRAFKKHPSHQVRKSANKALRGITHGREVALTRMAIKNMTPDERAKLEAACSDLLAEILRESEEP